VATILLARFMGVPGRRVAGLRGAGREMLREIDAARYAAR
jgi:hypothetical protein